MLGMVFVKYLPTVNNHGVDKIDRIALKEGQGRSIDFVPGFDTVYLLI